MKAAAAAKPDPDLAHEAPVAAIAPGTETKIHLQNLAISTALSRYYVKHFIKPEAVIDVLNAAGVRFMLAGAHAIGGWTNEPRTTQDVDVLVVSRHVNKAVQALQVAFPRLEVRDARVVARFVDPRTKKVVLDVMKANQPLFKDAMRHVREIQTKVRSYFVPSLEFALAMKFAAMTSPRRERDKKIFDIGDFARMVNANPVIDLAKLVVFGKRIYPGGGAEILDLVPRIRYGDPISL